MKPPWLKLIEEWQHQSHFGLTMPFLLGAMLNWPGRSLGQSDDRSVQLASLIASIRDDAPEGMFVRLYSCDRLHELVLALVSGPPGFCVPIPSPIRSQPSLYVESSVLPEGIVEVLVAELWHRYGKAIQQGRFSFRSGSFAPFDGADRRLIAAATARSDSDGEDA